MITVTQKGSFEKIEKFLRTSMDQRISAVLQRYGSTGVNALRAATPVDTNLAASSWGFRVSRESRSGWVLTFTNSDIETGFPVAIMIQYGHGTGTGGYVAGRDYINPAIQPIFDKISNDLWKEVMSG
jgi:hypothetical protein